MRVHGTCVALSFPTGDAGILLSGPPGSGKSDLGLRLIHEGARLVADDQLLVEERGGHLFGRAPLIIRGRMEVRGLGLVAVAWQEEVEIRLELALGEPVARLPEPAFSTIAGVRIVRLALLAFEASAAAKARLALHALISPIMPGVTFPHPPE
jgi:hypothetical protein